MKSETTDGLPEHERGGGNVFADLGLADAGEHQIKAWIVTHIGRRLREEGLTQTEAARRMGLHQPDLSAVLHGRFAGYSVERLARALAALGGEVSLTVRSSRRGGGQLRPGGGVAPPLGALLTTTPADLPPPPSPTSTPQRVL